jgi:tetratricopeptide (TPR) repeat protein
MSKKNRARTPKQHPVIAPDTQAGTGNWVIGLILAVTFLAFINTVGNGFAYDDTTQIHKNELIQVRSLGDFVNKLPPALTREVWFWRTLQDKDPSKETGPTTPYYRPMFTLYLMLGWTLFGDQAPGGWHLANVLMHLLAVYFAFLIMKKVTGDLTLSAIGTLLFAVHPLRTESVAWISGVTDLFLALFLLPSFYFYMLYREGGAKKYLALSLGLFLLGAFSKEPAVALPIFIFAYEIFIINRDKSLKERLRPAAIYGASFFLVSAAYFAMRYYALGFVLNDNRYTAYPFHEVLLTIPIVFCKYLGLLFWPMNLSIFHATPMVRSPLELRFILPTLALAALAFGLWRLRHSLVARFALLWFLIQMLPILNLTAFATEFMVQERYVYIPSIGFSLLLAMAIKRIRVEEWVALGSRRTAQVALVTVIALLLTAKTVAQNTVWENDLRLWTHGVEVASDQTMPYFVLGFEYVDQQRMDKVVETLEQYMKLDQNNLIVLSNLSAAHLFEYERTRDRAHVDRAIWLCEKGIQISDNPLLYDTLGRAYTFDTELQNYERAHVFFDRALRVDPQNPMVNFHKGATYAKQGKNDSAVHYLEFARQQEPSLPDTYKFLAYAYKGRGQIREAVDNFNKYLQLRPDALDAQRISRDLQELRAKL